MRRLSLLALFLSSTAGAVTTKTFSSSSFKDFDDGEGDHTVITSIGEVTPGLATDRVDVETDAVWAMVRAADGTLFLGDSSDGNIRAVDHGKSRVLASMFKDGVRWFGALALSPDGKTLYAGTLGTGSIYAIETQTGKATKLATADGAEHIWSLVVDPAGKTLYAGTGPAGKVMAVELPGGKTRELWDSDAKHILSMTMAKDGALWLGTSEDAILYRLDPKTGDARAIADFSGQEIKAVAESPDGMVVAANEFEQKGQGPPAPPPAEKGGTAVKAPPADSPGNEKPEGRPDRAGERKGKGGIFLVQLDGRVEQLHSVAEGYFQALAVSPSGEICAATGSNGRVYQIHPDRTVLTAFDVEERQVNALVATKDGVAFATGDAGAVYTSAGPAKDATYRSKVIDAGVGSRWGNLRWRGVDVALETRSGNTSKPDSAWSKWEKVASPTKAGGDAQIGRVASPPARYLQYRALLQGAGALREADVYYLPDNQRARLTTVDVGDSDAKKPPVTTATGVASPRSPVMKVKWKTENPDDDDLAYTIEYRPEGAADWTPVNVGADPYTKTDLDWNTETLPDGYYRMRVTASNRRANPPEIATSDARISEPFLVDNSKPRVEGLVVTYPNAAARAVDDFSRIDEIAYSVDGGDWTMAFPKDGIFDNQSEAFSLKLPDGLKAGNHTLSVRIADEGDNIGAASATFRVGK